MGIGSVFKAFSGANGVSNDAAKAALDQNYQKAAGQLQPWQTAGTDALGGYNALLTNPSSITSDPGYQFRLKQGQDVVQNNALAHGSFFSGNTAKALTDYGQGAASDELDKALSRYFPLLSLGSKAAGSAASVYTGEGNALSALDESAAKSRKAAQDAKLGAMGDLADSAFSYGVGKKWW